MATKTRKTKNAGVLTPEQWANVPDEYRELARQAKAFPYGEAFESKPNKRNGCITTLYKATKEKLPQITYEVVGAEPPKNNKPHFDDLTGYLFGNVLVLGFDRFDISKCSRARVQRWRCLCLLTGCLFSTLAHHLKHGSTTSSKRGGRMKAAAKQYGKDFSEIRNFKTSYHKHLYGKQWKGMMQRCGLMGDTAKDEYKGRGVSVCERVQDFDRAAPQLDRVDKLVRSYLERAGFDPSEKLELERVDANDHYREGNLSLAPKWIQGRSKRNSLDIVRIDELNDAFLEDGVTVHSRRAKEIAAELGANWRSVLDWVRPAGRSQALLKPRSAFLRAYYDDLDTLVLGHEPCNCSVCSGPKPTDPNAIPDGVPNGYQLSVLIDNCEDLHIQLFPGRHELTLQEINGIVARACKVLDWPLGVSAAVKFERGYWLKS